MRRYYEFLGDYTAGDFKLPDPSRFGQGRGQAVPELYYVGMPYLSTLYDVLNRSKTVTIIVMRDGTGQNWPLDVTGSPYANYDNLQQINLASLYWGGTLDKDKVPIEPVFRFTFTRPVQINPPKHKFALP